MDEQIGMEMLGVIHGVGGSPGSPLGLEMLGVIHGVEGSPCSPLGLPETLLEISWLNHYAKGTTFAHYFSWGNWADNTQSKRKDVTGERRNLKWNEKEQKQTKQQVHTREARTS